MDKNIKLATTNTVSSNYVGDVAGEIIGQSFLEGSTLSAGVLTVAENVNYKYNLRKLTYTDGTTAYFNIPLRMMRGSKPTTATVLENWPWTNPSYTFNTTKTVQSVTIDPLEFMADIDKTNNYFIKR